VRACGRGIGPRRRPHDHGQHHRPAGPLLAPRDRGPPRERGWVYATTIGDSAEISAALDSGDEGDPEGSRASVHPPNAAQNPPAGEGVAGRTVTQKRIVCRVRHVHTRTAKLHDEAPVRGDRWRVIPARRRPPQELNEPRWRWLTPALLPLPRAGRAEAAVLREPLG